MSPAVVPGFETHRISVGDIEIACDIGGSGPPVLLLHGFPQTRMMWHAIAPHLARTRTVVAADLRGYGDSAKPEGVENYSFREMAGDQVALMRHLGFDAFSLIGHDRGGRTAVRLALDHPAAVTRLAILDIVPTHLLFDQVTRQVAKAYYHWFFLAQPAPFPETLISADPDHYYQSALLGWGAAQLENFDATALDAYRTSWRRPDTIRAMCDDYRAAYEIDFHLDAEDLDRQIPCPALVLYGADGAMAKSYDVPATWAQIFPDMTSAAIPGGHFFPDTHPAPTLRALSEFLGRDAP